MEYIQATMEHLTKVFDIVQDTIKTIYPLYYPKEVVDFFCQLHSIENIQKNLANHSVGILIDEGIIVGTGCFLDEHITRVYVLPQYQKKGYGTYIMDCLELEISKKYKKAYLDASLPASHLYERRGYLTSKHCKYEVDNGVILVYEIMEKDLQNTSALVNYDGKYFVPKFNTDNGEVDGETEFSYHQIGSGFFAEYRGGEIEQGYMVGEVCANSDLNFYYKHTNKQGQIKMGKCHSVPYILNDGKVELHEEWQWLNDEKSQGNSIVTEK